MIYMDHAATTKLSARALDAMMPFLTENYGNAGSIYRLGTESKKAITKARRAIADTLNAQPNEIYFTSGGTESDNWAIKSVFDAKKQQGKHIITSSIEHHAVLHTCKYLEKQGAEITYIKADEFGRIDLACLERAIRPDTILISIMAANNEIGTLQPVKEIGAIAKKHGILFHTDAVQAYGQIPLDVEAHGIDLLSVSGHKLNGPKGIGFLYAKSGVEIGSFVHGGGQERGKRAGTENVPAIVGLATAALETCDKMTERTKKETILRDYMMREIETTVSGVKLNGHPKERLPGNVHFCFEGIESESALIMLDMEGICASGGSACTTGDEGPSHVLEAIGVKEELARSALRFTLGEENTKDEVDVVVGKLKEIVEKLRKMRG